MEAQSLQNETSKASEPTSNSNTEQETKEDQNNSKKRKLNLKTELLDCPLCQSLFYEPITTPCGHTFCRSCILRAMDHDNKCPMCRTPVHISPEYGVNVLLVQIIEGNFPEEYLQRKDEVQEEKNAQNFTMPLFLLGSLVLFPRESLSLHVFEPRYRLMIRRAMEGSRRFGIVAYINNDLVEIGTTAVIQNQSMLPDGRSLLQTVGEKRFKVKSLFNQDGYVVARIEYVEDEPLPQEPEKLKDIQEKCDKLRTVATEKLGTAKEQVEQKYGMMPTAPTELVWWLSAALPLSSSKKFKLLENLSLQSRIDSLFEVLNAASDTQHFNCSIQ
mmetsp:Transcript_3642/g.5046  ORF Transcript_3642/g.5046 Transcript_3642/m.5046 type:complete len:329 (-) Transcript_3642:1632-2618(-)